MEYRKTQVLHVWWTIPCDFKISRSEKNANSIIKTAQGHSVLEQQHWKCQDCLGPRSLPGGCAAEVETGLRAIQTMNMLISY